MSSEGREGARSTFEALRHRGFRLLWLGAFVSNVGTWVQNVAQGYLVYALTHRTGALGLANFANGIATLVLGPWAGVLADRGDRRKILVANLAIMMCIAAALGLLVQEGLVRYEHILAAYLLNGLAWTFWAPAYLSLLPELVPREAVVNAVALNAAQFNTARVVGPALAGVVIASLGMAGAFYLNSLSFLAVIAAILVVGVPRNEGDGEGEGAWESLKKGISLARSRPRVLRAVVAVVAVAALGGSLFTLLPALAVDRFGMGAEGLGLLMGVGGAGTMVGALAVARFGRGSEESVHVSALLAGAGLLLLPWAGEVWIALPLLFLVGLGYIASLASANSLMQLSAGLGERGRVMSLYVLALGGAFPLGSMALGLVGERLGAAGAFGVAGAALLLAAALLLFLSRAGEGATRKARGALGPRWE